MQFKNIFSERKIIIKRPLCAVCLAGIVLLFIIVKSRGLPQVLYPPEGTKLVVLEGYVYQKEGSVKDGNMVIYIHVTSEAKPFSVICYLTGRQDEPELGSKVRLKGKWESFERATNPGQFDSYVYYQVLKISYRLFQTQILAKSTTYNHLQEKLYQIRCFFAATLESSLPEKETAFMRTMLLGEKGTIDKDLKELYQRNGIAHILAISGVKTLCLVSPLSLESGLKWGFLRLHNAKKYIQNLCFKGQFLARCPPQFCGG